jgi:predicted lipoprotein with Yx(FWY)xxD motif
MIRGSIVAVGLGFALLAAACSSATTTSSTAAGSTAAGSTSDTVSVRQVPGVGSVYTDANGMALYTPAQEATGKISCVGACTSIWIPLSAPSSGSATESPDVHGTVGVIKRPDGSSQVTLNGAPLYRFYQDTAAGTANGNGISDSFGSASFTWHVAAPDSATSANAANSPSPATPASPTPAMNTSSGMYG